MTAQIPRSIMGCRALCLILLYGLIGSYAQQQCSLITPNPLRVDSEETIIVDGHGSGFNADIIVQDFPRKKFLLVSSKVSVSSQNQFLSDVKLMIPSHNLEKDPKKKQFVYISVKSPACNLEKVVLLSFHSGHIFIQTDKPIYTPGSTVLYRIFTMTPNLRPMSKRVIVEFLNNDVMVHKYTVLPESNTGITSLSYKLPDFLSLGQWTISAKFEDNIMHSYTTQFNVKEYVPSNIDIKITTSKKFFYIKDEELRVDIEANYLYGKPVTGKAFVIFGVQREHEKKMIPNTLRRIEMPNGEGFVVLRRRDLIYHFQLNEDMSQYRIFVSVTVITDSGSDLVESELSDIFIVTSPYKIRFTKTSKFFKPGMPFDFMVFVTNPDGSPAHDVPVAAEPGNVIRKTQADGTVQLTLNTGSDINQLGITVCTKDEKLTKDQQANATMVASAYRPIGGNYLHLSVTGGELKPGENAYINFIIRNNDPAVQNQINHFNYVIMNKGRIMKVGTQERKRGQTYVTMLLEITEEFIPSFRIVAYYTVTTGAGREIVADSMWIDVADVCIGTLTITGEKERDNTIQQPGSAMKLKLLADHNAVVGLVAVDKGVYVTNSKLMTSQKKVWDIVEKDDIGCTPGSGADTPGVFYDAGLALQTNFQITTPQRSEPLCHAELKRRRRSSGHDDDEYLPDADIVSRIEFPESWFWQIVTMTERPDINKISTKVLNVFLKDSITTWEVLAVSLSQNKGICVAKPYEIQVLLREIFIDLKLPYSVVRNEQVEIRAILYNYGSNDIKVRVELSHNPEFCSLSTPKAKFRQIVEIRKQSSIAVPFILVPLSLGLHDVEVKASISGLFLADGVRKKLKVVPEGVRITKLVKLVTLEPKVKGQNGVQEEKVSPLDEKNIVPGTDVLTIVTIQGNPIIQLEEAVDGANLNHLFVVPRGPGEENMIIMSHGVIAATYLDATNQWERIVVNRREEAIKNIKQGYTQQLVYRKADNSYAAFKNRPASTWLTAFVAKVFALAQPLVEIETGVLCGAIKWLIIQKQKSDGMFKEDSPVIHQEMVGAIKGASEDVALTAFVLIAMLESEKICTPHVNNLKISIDKAASFLLGQLPGLQKPYVIAITSYALAMAEKIDHPEKLLSASTDKLYWDEPGSRFITIEATSYALLALLSLKQYDLTGPIVRWIKEQRFYGHIFGSNQATIVMFQALTKYQTDIADLNEIDLDVSLSLPERQAPLKYRINLENALLARSAETRMNKEFIVKAQGKGQGTLTVMSIYHALVTEKEMECKNFDLSVTAKEEQVARAPEDALATVSLEICARFLKDTDATMSILDVSMMTGFDPDVESLNKLAKRMGTYISKFEINKDATDKRSLIIYLDKISHKEQDCIKFNVHQVFKVGLIQPASVTVYDYYTPENRCSKFYHVYKDSKLLSTICQKDVCRCAEAIPIILEKTHGSNGGRI